MSTIVAPRYWQIRTQLPQLWAEVMDQFAGLHDIRATKAEINQSLPGDDTVPRARLVFDRGVTLCAPPAEVWGWLQQIGRVDDHRSGWYLPAWVEQFLPLRRRPIRFIDPRITLEQGQVIKDWASPSKTATAQAVLVNPPHHLVFVGQRGHTRWSWAVALQPHEDGQTRLHMRARLGKPRRRAILFLLQAGEPLDLLFTAGFRTGLQERLG